MKKSPLALVSLPRLPRPRGFAPGALTRSALSVGAFAFSGLLLTGCAAQADEAEPISIFATEVGDCFTTDEDNTAAFTVPCEEPHVYEVSAVHPIDADDYPGDEEVQALTDETCPEAFLTYTGEVPAASTEWASMAFAPSEPGWAEQDERNIVCVVTSLDGEPASGSAKE